MQIDWFTLVAQIINFLILLVLLRLVLYKPVLRAMDEREEKIASRLEEAEQKHTAAQEEAETYRHKRQEIDAERDEILKQARAEVERKRNALMEDARQDVDQARADWHHSLEREKQAFLRDLRARVNRQVFAVIRRALSDLADTELEEQMVRRFVQRLRSTAQDENQALTQILRDGHDITIYSAFELSDDARNAIASALERHSPNLHLEYRIDTDAISGLTLTSNDYQLGWNFDDYLETLEANVREALDEEIGVDTAEQEKEVV